jgi:hypothetical protein
MDPELGFKGPSCPVNNCYMRDENTGACTASTETKASSKLMRDAMTIVEIVDATRNAPEWAKFTMVTSLNAKHEKFIKEAELDAGKLQYVLDHNPLFNATLENVFKSQAEEML